MYQVQGGVSGFRYDIHARRPKLSDLELLDGLRRFAAMRKGKPLRYRDFEAWKRRPYNPMTAVHRFGSWCKALSLVGLRGTKALCDDPEMLIANLEAVWRQMGRAPGRKALQTRGKFSERAYGKRWGSLRRACELLAAHHRGEITREELMMTGLPAGPARVKRALPLDVRWAVLKRDSYKCVVCGKSPATSPGLELEVDHIHPVSRGGSNEEANLRTLCKPCNQGKKDGV